MKYSIYGGTGFVGGNFCRMYSDITLPIERNERDPLTNKVIYFISTVHNYHVYDDLHIDKTIISEAYPHLNELQQQEVYDLIHKTTEILATNFKNLGLQATICKHNLQFTKITCISKNESDHFKKELNHLYGYQNSYGFQFSLTLMHPIKQDDSSFVYEKPKFLIQENYWNNRIEANQYQGNELISLN